MAETFPHHSLPAKCLRDSSEFDDRAEDVKMSYLSNCRLIVRGGYPKSLDTNIFSGEGPLVEIAISTIYDRGGDRTLVRYFIR